MSKACEICGDSQSYCAACGTCHACLELDVADRNAEIARLKECLGWALEYIDAIPSEAAAVFPAMPGFDRDYVNDVAAGLKPDKQ